MSSLAYYVEINLFCVCILLLLLLNVSRVSSQSMDNKIFRWLLILTTGFCVADLGSWIFNAGTGWSHPALCMIFNMIYFITSGVVGLLWLMYTVVRITRSNSMVVDRAKYWAIPVVIFVLLTLTTPWTKLIFYVDETGEYCRGKAVFLHWIVSYSYIFAMLIYSGYSFLREKSKGRRHELLLINSLCVPPLVASVIQITHEGLTTIQVGLVLSILIAFVSFQNRQISRDALTGTNNRSQMERYLTDRMRTMKPEERIFLLLLDVDDFKGINDTYGHVVGDRALVEVAKILKIVCGRRKNGLFLARYGGDEFAIVGFDLDETMIPQLLADIEEETRRTNEETMEKYRLSISVGCAKGLCKDFRNLDELLEAADNEMYKNKKAKKLLK